MKLKNIIAGAAIAGTILATNAEARDNLESNISILTNKEQSHQIDLDAKLDIDSFNLYFTGAIMPKDENFSMLVGLKTSKCFEHGKLDLSPYVRVFSNLDNAVEDPNSFAYGTTLGYDISENFNFGIDLRKVNKEDDLKFGLYFKIQN
jgi:hypothetical protein